MDLDGVIFLMRFCENTHTSFCRSEERVKLVVLMGDLNIYEMEITNYYLKNYIYNSKLLTWLVSSLFFFSNPWLFHPCVQCMLIALNHSFPSATHVPFLLKSFVFPLSPPLATRLKEDETLPLAAITSH